MIASDSSTLIAFFQGEYETKDVIHLRNSIKNSFLFLPPVVIAEILSATNITKEIEETINVFPTLELKSGFWQRLGKTRHLLLKKKFKANIADCIIAQSCIDHDIPLITRDKDFRHYEKYCGLKLI